MVWPTVGSRTAKEQNRTEQLHPLHLGSRRLNAPAACEVSRSSPAAGSPAYHQRCTGSRCLAHTCLPADRHRCASLDRALLQTSDRWSRQTVPSPSRILYLLQHIVAYITGQNCDTTHLRCTARQCHFFSVEHCGRQVAPVSVIQSTVNDYQCDRGGGCVACWIA